MTIIEGEKSGGGNQAILVDSSGHLQTDILSGENHIGEVGGSSDVISVTITLDTAAYTAGDVLFDTQEIVNAVRVNGGTAVLQYMRILDKDDQGGAMDILLLDANTSIGTENNALNIADSAADDIKAIISVTGSDYVDLTNSKMAVFNGSDAGMGAVLKADPATTSLYVAGVSRDAKTYTANGIVIEFGFLQD